MELVVNNKPTTKFYVVMITPDGLVFGVAGPYEALEVAVSAVPIVMGVAFHLWPIASFFTWGTAERYEVIHKSGGLNRFVGLPT